MASTYTTNFNIEKPARGDDANTWDVPVNANWTILDSILGGTITVAMSSTTVTIPAPTSEVVSGNQYIRYVLTGALAANSTLVFPAVGGVYVIDNQTSGAFSLTVKTSAGGSTGVAVQQGVRSLINIDGTNVYFADDRVTNQASFGVVQSIAAAATTDLGAVTTRNANITGSGVSITSFGTSAPAVLPVYLVLFSGANTIVYNATSMITPSGANITTASGDSAIVVNQSYGSGNWQIISYTRAIPQSGTIASFQTLYMNNNAGTPLSKLDVTFNNAVLQGAGYSNVLTGSGAFSVNSTVNGANGLDIGTVAPSTWYHVYAISNGSTVAGLFSTSATAPTLPSGYTFSGRMGAIKTDASSNLMKMIYRGNNAQYLGNGPVMASGIAGSPAAGPNIPIVLSSYYPSTAQRVRGVLSSGTGVAVVSPDNGYGGYTSTTNPPPCIAAVSGAYMSEPFDFVVETSSIYWASNSAACFVNALGWTDSVNAV